jgi:hypothetical protein
MAYMPPLSSSSLHIWKSEKNVETQSQQLESEKESILNYLAGNTTQGSLEPEPARTTIPELGNNACCDTTVFEIFFRLVCNPWQLAKDAVCGCFVPFSMPDPDHNTYVPKHVYNRLRSADVYLNRNTCLLCCVTPPVMTTCAYAGYLPVSASTLLGLTSTAGAAANGCSLVSAGWLTYFWSGDFGGREQKSYEEMKGIFDDLADYLDSKWHSVQNSPSEDDFKQLCEKIRRNSRNIVNGMQNGGISSLHTEDVTKKFFNQIFYILKGSHFKNIDKKIGQSTSQVPSMEMIK